MGYVASQSVSNVGGVVCISNLHLNKRLGKYKTKDKTKLKLAIATNEQEQLKNNNTINNDKFKGKKAKQCHSVNVRK